MGALMRTMGRAIVVPALLAALVAVLAAPRPARAGETGDLLALSIEALMQVKVVSASATARTLDDSAAAVYVLTADDIRRSGARDLPELLRQVPGLQVARISDHTWAVSARGFNGRFANLLLVLVDGRPVYDPLYGGVYWDAQSVPLWNVERIEVVRGPGGDLWGANAVNGVINVITRDAASTRGGYVAGGAGRDERAYAAAREGVSLGERGDLTLYAQGFDRTVRDWNESRGGFRWDRRLGAARLSVNGEGYDGRAERQAYFASLSPPGAHPDRGRRAFRRRPPDGHPAPGRKPRRVVAPGLRRPRPAGRRPAHRAHPDRGTGGAPDPPHGAARPHGGRRGAGGGGHVRRFPDRVVRPAP